MAVCLAGNSHAVPTSGRSLSTSPDTPSAATVRLGQEQKLQLDENKDVFHRHLDPRDCVKLRWGIYQENQMTFSMTLPNKQVELASYQGAVNF